MQNICFVEIGIAGQTDFILVRHSATSNCLPRNKRFRFQGNLVKVSSIRECMSNKVYRETDRRDTKNHFFVIGERGLRNFFPDKISKSIFSL
jgi:hypothetical protein